MNIFFNNHKRIILGLFMLAMFLPVGFFQSPQKASASATGSLIAGNFMDDVVKDFSLDGLAWIVTKRMIASMAQSTTEWINSGFEGEPSFLRNQEDFFLDIADQSTGQLISELGLQGSAICGSFRPAIQLMLADTRTQLNRYSCTFGSIAEELDRFENDFKDGGWSRFIQVSSSNNNYFGASYGVTAAAAQRITQSEGKSKNELDWGGGFATLKGCVNWDTDWDIEKKAYKKPKYGVDSQARIDELEAKARSFPPSDGGIKGCLRAENSTPGKVLGDQLMTSLGASTESLNQADEIAEGLASIIDALFNQMIQAGVRGLSKSGSKFRGEDKAWYTEGTEETKEELLTKIDRDLKREEAMVFFSAELAESLRNIEETEICYNTQMDLIYGGSEFDTVGATDAGLRVPSKNRLTRLLSEIGRDRRNTIEDSAGGAEVVVNEQAISEYSISERKTSQQIVLETLEAIDWLKDIRLRTSCVGVTSAKCSEVLPSLSETRQMTLLYQEYNNFWNQKEEIDRLTASIRLEDLSGSAEESKETLDACITDLVALAEYGDASTLDQFLASVKEVMFSRIDGMITRERGRNFYSEDMWTYLDTTEEIRACYIDTKTILDDPLLSFEPDVSRIVAEDYIDGGSDKITDIVEKESFASVVGYAYINPQTFVDDIFTALDESRDSVAESYRLSLVDLLSKNLYFKNIALFEKTNTTLSGYFTNVSGNRANISLRGTADRISRELSVNCRKEDGGGYCPGMMSGLEGTPLAGWRAPSTFYKYGWNNNAGHQTLRGPRVKIAVQNIAQAYKEERFITVGDGQVTPSAKKTAQLMNYRYDNMYFVDNPSTVTKMITLDQLKQAGEASVERIRALVGWKNTFNSISTYDDFVTQQEAFNTYAGSTAFPEGYLQILQDETIRLKELEDADGVVNIQPEYFNSEYITFKKDCVFSDSTCLYPDPDPTIGAILYNPTIVEEPWGTGDPDLNADYIDERSIQYEQVMISGDGFTDPKLVTQEDLNDELEACVSGKENLRSMIQTPDEALATPDESIFDGGIDL